MLVMTPVLWKTKLSLAVPPTKLAMLVKPSLKPVTVPALVPVKVQVLAILAPVIVP